MAKKSRSPKKGARAREENVCAYCLFFQPRRAGRRPLEGNCYYHKQWIENASLTTCSDMSCQSLGEEGIYHLVSNQGDGWTYIRRQEKLRTRLFLIKD